MGTVASQSPGIPTHLSFTLANNLPSLEREKLSGLKSKWECPSKPKAGLRAVLLLRNCPRLAAVLREGKICVSGYHWICRQSMECKCLVTEEWLPRANGTLVWLPLGSFCISHVCRLPSSLSKGEPEGSHLAHRIPRENRLHLRNNVIITTAAIVRCCAVLYA